jgi:GH18 family chitinase
VLRHDLDGFDVDWEYRGCAVLTTPSAEDKQNFTALMAELRAALGHAGRELAPTS